MCAKAGECQASPSMIWTSMLNNSPRTGAERLCPGHGSTRTSPSSGRAASAEMSSALVIGNGQLKHFSSRMAQRTNTARFQFDAQVSANEVGGTCPILTAGDEVMAAEARTDAPSAMHR